MKRRWWRAYLTCWWLGVAYVAAFGIVRDDNFFIAWSLAIAALRALERQ